MAATSDSSPAPPGSPPTLALQGDPADSLVDALRRDEIGTSLFGGPRQVSTIGRFEVRGMLGRGGMGTVIEAHDPTLARRVAVKLLHRGSNDHEDQRLLREAQALARLSHPNVVAVYEVGTIDGRLFVAMELVRGQVLEDWQATARPWRACIEVYAQAGAGLAAAHAGGLVHRDFKPANCILDEHGRLRVLDFGLARDARLPVVVEGLDATAADSTREPSCSRPLARSPCSRRGWAATPPSMHGWWWHAGVAHHATTHAMRSSSR